MDPKEWPVKPGFGVVIDFIARTLLPGLQWISFGNGMWSKSRIPVRRSLGVGGMLLLLLSSCQLFTRPHSPKGYMMPRPEMHILGKKLSEISGIFYLNGTGSMLAIADDKKHIYRVYTDGTIDDFFSEEFAPSSDYEDVVQVDSTIYVLASDATLFATVRADSGLRTESYHLDVPLPATVERDEDGKAKEGSVDFETVYYDPGARGLILLAKNIKGENK
ncbi:MAG: hypothetical protein EOP50_16795, partial [Sphingobacteriales bacterium]